MSLVELIFGRVPSLKTIPDSAPRISEPPSEVIWHRARARAVKVNARLARQDGVLRTRRGVVPYSAEQHYIVRTGSGQGHVVQRDVFERTYEKLKLGTYRKRRDLIHRYFTLPYAVVVMTREGPEPAAPGDWIMEDIDGALYPVSRARAADLYEEEA